MSEAMRQAVADIRSWLAHTTPGEAVVRQCIVLRLLQAAGFDIWNPDEVVPEETNSTGSRADFLIRRGAGKFALEVKGMGVTLGAREYQQAATYAVNEGSRWAIVTNGRVWVVIDEHLPGRWEDRVALKAEMGQGDSFAADLFSLLSADTWAADAFAGAVDAVRLRQQQRRDEARIRREKHPVVQQTQTEFEIASYEKAAEAAVKMGRITEGERDVLLGGKIEPEPGEIEFTLTLRRHGAKATCVYCPTHGTWTVKAGSTATSRILESYGSGHVLRQRREEMLVQGILIQESTELLRYAQDVIYRSPSSAASAISGSSMNGWDVWKDREGQRAGKHHPG